MPAARVDLELPFGKRCDAFYCPACGAPIAQPEHGLSPTPCEHLRFVYLESVGLFAFVADDLREALDRAERAADEAADEAWDPLDAVCALLPEQNVICVHLTTGGMACGPVWESTVYGLDLLGRGAREHGRERDAEEPVAAPR